MPRKIKTITINANPVTSDYSVVRLTDTLEYRPGQILTKAQAKELCDSPNWKVSIIGGAD